MAELQQQLTELFVTRSQHGEPDAQQDALAATHWANRIHCSFYGASAAARGSNKFLELEATLTQVFTGLGRLAGSAFWEFVVHVVLQLVQEPHRQVHRQQQVLAAESIAAPVAVDAKGQTKKKAKKKLSQPNAPLSFVVVNALRDVTEEEGGELQRSHCHSQGRTNAQLRAFCLRGLQDAHLVVHEDQKLVVELLDLFAIKDIEPEAVRNAAQSLLAAKKYTALIKLFTAFSSFDWSFEETIKAIVKAKDWSAAELLARTFSGPGERELAKVLVDEAVALQEFKRAHRVVYNFSLQDEYPDIDMLYCHDGLMKLIERRRWKMALSFAGNDASLQKVLLDHLVAAEEIQWAAQLAEVLGIRDFEAHVARVIAQRGSLVTNGLPHSNNAASSSGCLGLELQDGDIVFCNTDEAIRRAMNHFFGEESEYHKPAPMADDGGTNQATAFTEKQVVGLDVEWKPTSTRIAAATGSTMTIAVASILQIASLSRVFLVDLLALHVRGKTGLIPAMDNDFLFETFLRRLFVCPHLLKVGFGFDSDLKGLNFAAYITEGGPVGGLVPRSFPPAHLTAPYCVCIVPFPLRVVLHQTFPERSALTRISPFLELNVIASKLLGVSVGNSLSNATTRVLGRPLDKRMQLSNWDERPLSSTQMTYAALDAYCLVQMVHQLRAGADELPSWREAATYVHDLVYSSPLSGEEASNAIALREEYRQHWLQSINTHATTSVAEAAVVDLLTTRDIEKYWEARKRLHCQEQLGRSAGAGDGVEEALDTELVLLRAQTVKDLLQQPPDPTQPVVFVVVNSICFFADEHPCVACIEATCKLDTARLATLCGVGRRRIKLATPVECCEHFGFAPGTVPPFGHRSMVAGAEASGWEAPQVRIYASESLQQVKYLACGGGSPETLLWLNSRAFFALLNLEAVGDIQRGMSAVHFSDSTQEPLTSSTAAAPANPEQQLELTLEYKFLADSMVARVGKWLRTIGMDVIVWDPYAASTEAAGRDQKAALLALAVREQRILLTRDKKLASRRDAGACFVVSSDDPFQQFQEIKTHFALRLVKEEMMSRCSRCNAKGFDVVDLDYVRTQTADEVHPNVLEVVTEFWVCRVCHKIYWEGPKYDSNYANLLRMFDDNSIIESQHPLNAAVGEE